MIDESVAAQALCNVMEKALIAEGISPPIARTLAQRACQPAVKTGVKATKKKVSRYSRELGRQYKKMKKKFPRSKHSSLLKKAHQATKRILK